MTEPICKECGKPIPWGKNESVKVHMKRKFCSRRCGDIGRMKSNHPWNTGFRGGESYL